jgi:F-type H+-transporting ATPase subunit delta
MAEIATVARPYAKAVFRLAREHDKLAPWTEQLELAAAVVKDQEMGLLLGSPRLTTEQKADMIIDICGDQLDADGANLVRLLVNNRRIALMPEIAAQYRKLRAEVERTVESTLVTAQAIDDELRDRIRDALAKRLDRNVSLETEVDESLIGGAIVKADDTVIDGSVRGKLARLAGAMSR